MTGNNRNNNGEFTFEIVEHIGVLDVYDNHEEKWTKEGATCFSTIAC